MHERADAMIAILRQQGLRITPQRVALVREFATDTTHPTAQELFERLRPSFPSMSFATVYNTLDALAQSGLSTTLRLGGAARFDPNIAPHHHAVCDTCGATFDVPTKTLAPQQGHHERVEDVAPGFVVRRVDRTYRGLCAACSTETMKKET